MTVGTFLAAQTRLLQQHGISTARLDCLVLLEDELRVNRTHLLAHPELELTLEQQQRLTSLIERRASHEPLAYLRHKTEFYGHEFYIDHHVLEPRPESETMMDQLQRLPLGTRPVVVDVGTGSGALAITAKRLLPQATVIGIDIDADCLAVAARNAASAQVDVTFLRGNLLEPLAATTHQPSVLLANLPYVPDNFIINPAAMQEPRLAIFGGPDGLDIYRQLFSQLATLPRRPTFVLTEALPPQHEQLAIIAASAHYTLVISDDFIQQFVGTDPA